MTISIDKQVSVATCDTHERRDWTASSWLDPEAAVVCILSANNRWDSAFIFTEVNIPNSAPITAAKMTLYIKNDLNDDIYANIYGEDIDSAVNFEDGGDIHSRAKTTAYSVWDATSIGTEWHDSPDFKDVAQEIVNRPLWVPNNNMCFIIFALGAYPDRNFVARTYDYDTTLAAKLHIEYTPVAKPRSFGCIIG